LRSERWRRAHGIGPRRLAQQPWLAEGISRSTWYRRRKKARDAATVRASLDRAESFAAALTRDLARCAALERESMAIIAELAALAAGGLTPHLEYHRGRPERDDVPSAFGILTAYRPRRITPAGVLPSRSFLGFRAVFCACFFAVFCAVLFLHILVFY
jgi:hypothetical protein